MRIEGGSSPHTRGAPASQVTALGQLRIIPAYAGSTMAGVLITGVLPDHPRIRGEHSEGRAARERGHGSSPHTRGAPDPAGRPDPPWRIIPAYAGSTSLFSSPSPAITDHPRIRGEHDVGGGRSRRVEGSSPHTRGALDDFVGLVSELGIIPAYAGSTHRLGCAGDFGRDHPRIRGEHIKSGFSMVKDGGSSPHTRGAPHRVGGDEVGDGIIPAYAGSTAVLSPGISSSWDHPRIRGEHFTRRSKITLIVGSSPHTRGALYR